MDFVPEYRLYASDGTTLIYTFTGVQHDLPFQDSKKFIEHTSLRAQGGIITSGGDDVYDYPLQFVLLGNNYEEIIAKMKEVKDTILISTKYILRFDLTVLTTESVNVIRYRPLNFIDQGHRVNYQKIEVIFRCGVWK